MQWTQSQKTNMQLLLDALAVRAEAKRKKQRQERMERGEGVQKSLRPLSSNDPVRQLNRIFAMIDTTTDGCWNWKGAHTPFGYGNASIFRIALKATRVVFQVFNGQIPSGLSVLHKCDNPKCCNPDHLFLGTYQDNNRDKAEKGRAPRGSANVNAKMTEEFVASARKRYKWREVTARMLANEVGVSITVMRRAIIGVGWRHV